MFSLYVARIFLWLEALYNFDYIYEHNLSNVDRSYHTNIQIMNVYETFHLAM